jgi:hypothetical protein
LAGLESESSHIANLGRQQEEQGVERCVSGKEERRKSAMKVILKTQWSTPGSAQPPPGLVGIAGPAFSGWLGPGPTLGELLSG